MPVHIETIEALVKEESFSFTSILTFIKSRRVPVFLPKNYMLRYALVDIIYSSELLYNREKYSRENNGDSTLTLVEMKRVKRMERFFVVLRDNSFLIDYLCI